MSQILLLNRLKPTNDSVATADSVKWDESKHPRKGGKFAPKGTGTTGKTGGKETAKKSNKSGGSHFNATAIVKSTPIQTAMKLAGVSSKLAKKAGFEKHFKSGLTYNSSPNHSYTKSELKSLARSANEGIDTFAEKGNMKMMYHSFGELAFAKLMLKNYSKGVKSEYDVPKSYGKKK